MHNQNLEKNNLNIFRLSYYVKKESLYLIFAIFVVFSILQLFIKLKIVLVYFGYIEFNNNDNPSCLIEAST